MPRSGKAPRSHSGACLSSTQTAPLPDMGVAHVLINTLNPTVRDAPREPDER
jgi:hypothetical protein